MNKCSVTNDEHFKDLFQTLLLITNYQRLFHPPSFELVTVFFWTVGLILCACMCVFEYVFIF